jgi:hypothetical protein
MLSCMSRCLQFRQDNVIRTELRPNTQSTNFFPGSREREPSGIHSKTLTNHDIHVPFTYLVLSAGGVMNKEGIDKSTTNPNNGVCVLAKFITGVSEVVQNSFIHLVRVQSSTDICIPAKFKGRFSEIVQNSFIHLHCIAWLLPFCKATVNRQHPPVHQER